MQELKHLCQFYENVIETQITQDVVNEQICKVRKNGWDLVCSCYNCSRYIQHYAIWQKDAQLNIYKTQSQISNLFQK